MAAKTIYNRITEANARDSFYLLKQFGYTPTFKNPEYLASLLARMSREKGNPANIEIIKLHPDLKALEAYVKMQEPENKEVVDELKDIHREVWGVDGEKTPTKPAIPKDVWIGIGVAAGLFILIKALK